MLSEFFADLGEFFIDFTGNACGARPVEADFTGFFLELGGFEEGGQAGADAVKVGFFLVAFLGSLDVLPLGEDAIGAADMGVTIDVGVAADEFVADAAGDVIEVETFVFRGEFGVEDDLEEKVAEFLLQVFLITGADCGDGFVGFLDEVGDEGFVSLFSVPRAAIGRAEAIHDGAEAFDLASGLLVVDHFIVGHLSRRALLRVSFSFVVRDWIPCSLILSRMRSTSLVSSSGEREVSLTIFASRARFPGP